MAYRAKIHGPCPHDGMAFPLELEGQTAWPAQVGLLDADGKEFLYRLLTAEPVDFALGQHPNLMLTAVYGPVPHG